MDREVALTQALELDAARNVGQPFDLRGRLVIPADHERNARVVAQVLEFGEVVRVSNTISSASLTGETDDGRLRGTDTRDGGFDRELVRPQKRQQAGAGSIHHRLISRRTELEHADELRPFRNGT
jgi:hypothetical protein